MTSPETKKDNLSVETSDTTSAEILELKKSIAKDFVKKNFDSSSSLKKWMIKNYLVDGVVWEVCKALWLLPQDIEEYREMFREAQTKEALENLRNKIYHETWWTKPVTTTHISNTPSESSDTVDNNSWIVKKACQIAVDIANDDSYWYERWGTGNTNGKKWFDCQSFVRHCYIKAWINVPPSWSCNTLKGDFGKVWFECITFNKNDKLKPWDILVDTKGTRKTTGHTEMCVWEDQIAWAHWNKDGGRAWDSGWKEISIRSVKSSLSYWSPQFILRYKW